MSLTDDIEQKTGIRIEKMTAVEKETYFAMLHEVEKAQMTLEKLRDHIIAMREAVGVELCKHDLGSEQDLFLKARLKNYILLESLLVSPQRAKEQLEDMVANIGKKVII